MPTTTVLLVDDSPDDAMLIREALVGPSADTSFDVVVVTTLADALSSLATRDIQCVLLDMALRDAAGVECIAAIVGVAPGVPVVALTACSTDGLGPRAVRHGADDYLVKSELDGPELQHAVHHATERADARAGLRDHTHLRGVLDALNDGVIVRSVSGEIVTINSAAQAILGVPSAVLRDVGYLALGGRPYFYEDGTRCTVDDLPSSVALRTGRPVNNRVMFVEQPDGTRLWIECTATLLRSEVDGSVTGVVSTLRDLTARRSADESREFRSQLLDAVGQSVIATDPEGHVIYWNTAAEGTYGWTAAEALGRPINELTRAEASREQAAEILHAVAAGETWTGEFPVRRRDGSSFLAMVSQTPVVDADGSLVAVIGVSTDITEMREANESMRLQAALLAAVGQSVVATDANDRVVYWNAASTRLFGWTEEEMLGQDASATLAHESRLEQARELEEDLRRGASWVGDLLMRRKDGSVFTAVVSTSPVADDSGEVVKFIAVMADVTERRQAEEAMRRLSAIVESTGDAVIGESLDGRILTWNPGAQRLMGFTADEAVGQKFTAFIPDDRLDEFHQVFGRATEGVITEGLESVRRHKDGSLVDVSLTLSPWRDADGRIAGVSTIARDIGDRKRMERALEHVALHDALTGLANRTLLADRLVQGLAGARRRERHLAVLFIDIDNFKVLNDVAGHPAGDRVLVEIASRLRLGIRPGDTVSRFGGDEFVVLFEATDAHAPWALAERLHDALKIPVEVDGQSHVLTASIGIALSDDECTADALLRDADAAVHQAKESGRARISIFDAEMHVRAVARLAAPAALRRALDGEEFRVHFQPILDVCDERLRGFEALVRWQHPERGFVSPSEFIGHAEETGLIVPLGELVLNRALAEASRWATVSDGTNLPFVSVNLSARQLAEPGLAAMIAAGIDEYRWPAERLTLEVTESVIMDDVAHSIDSLRALRDIGVRVSIDDFGTGYSSLSYLKRLPVNSLKIDRSFIDGLGVDPHDSAIVDAIMALARTLGLRVVAEGVETRRQLDELRRLECDFAQGFLWSPAVSGDVAIEWVQRSG